MPRPGRRRRRRRLAGALRRRRHERGDGRRDRPHPQGRRHPRRRRRGRWPTACRRAWAASPTATAASTRGSPPRSWASRPSRASRSATASSSPASAARRPTTRSSTTTACIRRRVRPLRRHRGRHDHRRGAARPRRDEADLDRPAGAADRRHRHRRGRRGHQPALGRLRRPGRRRRRRGDGRARARRGGAGEVRRRRRRRDPPQRRRLPRAARRARPDAGRRTREPRGPDGSCCVGLPGAGKSTSGRRLAKILAVPFADSDDLVEAARRPHRAPRSSPTPASRRSARSRRRRSPTRSTGFDGVLALGGGALTTRATRAARRRAPACRSCCCARASTPSAPASATRRTRPLLAADPAARLAELAAERAPAVRRARRPHRRHRRPHPGPGRGHRRRPAARAAAHRHRMTGASDDVTRIEVAGAVAVPGAGRHGPARRARRRCSAGAARVAVMHPPTLRGDAPRRSATTWPAQGFEAHADRGARRRGRQDARRRRVLLGRPRPDRLHPLRRRRRARRGSDHRPRRLGRRGLAARRARRARRRRRWPAWSTPRSAARPASTPTAARTSSARSTRRPACCATSRPLDTLPPNDYLAGLAEVVKCGFIADPAILDLIEADPAAAARAGQPGRARAGRALGAGQGPRSSARTSPSRACARSSTTATPSATPSSGPSATAGGTAPRCRSGWSTPPRSAALLGRLDDATADRHRAVLDSLGLPTAYARRRVPGAARDDAHRQEGPGQPAALRRARRPGPPGVGRRPGPRGARRGLLGGGGGDAHDPDPAARARAQRPEPRPARHPRARRLRRTRPTPSWSRCAPAAAPSSASTSRCGRATTRASCWAGCTRPPTPARRSCSTPAR